MAEDDFEIQEPGEYNYNKDEKYSHSTLLMAALKVAQENRAKEMRDGYWNTKFDRAGNAHKVWIPDSREQFIESVESLMMIQARDYDEESQNKLIEIKSKLKEKYDSYCISEEEEWKKMNIKTKTNHLSNGIFHRKGLLSNVLPYKFLYIRDKVESYTEIVSIIQKLIKRIGDYKEEIYEA